MGFFSFSGCCNRKCFLIIFLLKSTSNCIIYSMVSPLPYVIVQKGDKMCFRDGGYQKVTAELKILCSCRNNFCNILASYLFNYQNFTNHAK